MLQIVKGLLTFPRNPAHIFTHCLTKQETKSRMYWRVFIWVPSWFACADYKKEKLIKSNWGEQLYFDTCMYKFLIIYHCMYRVSYASHQIHVTIISLSEDSGFWEESPQNQTGTQFSQKTAKKVDWDFISKKWKHIFYVSLLWQTTS